MLNTAAEVFTNVTQANQKNSKAKQKQNTQLLKLDNRNAKTGPSVWMLNLPAGRTCPGAKDCWSRFNPQTGTIEDGPDCKFRCFSAVQECSPNVRISRNRNLSLLRQAKTVSGMAQLIEASFPDKGTQIRLHTSGDFYSQNYFDAWLAVATRRPDLLIYGYSKSLHFWVARLGSIPANLILTASYGGKYDHLIAQHHLRYAKVVFSPEEAAGLGLQIDHDDSHAQHAGPSFALLIHGIQKAGTPAATAIAELKRRGVQYSYRRPTAGPLVSARKEAA